MCCKSWKTFLPFFLTFVCGILTVTFFQSFANLRKASPTIEKVIVTKDLTFYEPKSNSEKELTNLKGKLSKLYKKPCVAPFDGLDDSICLYEIQNLLEIKHLEIQIDFINAKNQGLNLNNFEFETRLRNIGNELGKVNYKIKNFETDYKAGKIDRKTYSRSLKYFENCVQK